MSKNIFKIMGVLLVTALFVSISVGAVSAATHAYSVDIVDDSLALTKDVPVWPATDLGYFVPAESGVGAIRQAYVDGLISSVTISYNNTTKEFSVVEINGDATDSTHTWTVMNGVTPLTSVTTGIGTNPTVSYIYTNNGIVEQQYDITVSIVPENNIWNDDITFTTGMTGEQALAAASDEGENFTYNVTVTDAGTTYEYVWLLDINGISKNWSKTGYGYAIALDNNATDALNRFTVNGASVFKISMAASSYGGLPYTGMNTFCDDGYGGYYYSNSITDSVTINSL